MLRKGRKFLLHPPCYSCYKPGCSVARTSLQMDRVVKVPNMVCYNYFIESTNVHIFKNMNYSTIIPLYVGGLQSCLFYLCLFTYSGVQHILCVCFVFFVLCNLFYCPFGVLFVLCNLCCPFFFIVPSVFSNIHFSVLLYLFSFYCLFCFCLEIILSLCLC